MTKKQKIKKGYRLCLALAFILPLFGIGMLFTPPSFVKGLLFRSLFTILLVLFTADALFLRRKRVFKPFWNLKKEGKILFTLTALLPLIYLASSLLSPAPIFSLLGEPTRGGGVLNLLLFSYFALICFLVLDKNDWQQALKAGVLTAGLVSITGILQRFQLTPGLVGSFSSRPPATLGNAVMFGLYLTLFFFPALTLSLKGKKKTEKFLFFTVALVIFLGLIASGTRGAWLGCFFGGFLFLFSLFKKKSQKVLLALFLLLILAGFFLLRANPDLLKFKDPLLNQTKERVLSISLKAGERRISAWKISLEAIKEKPLFGWGPENYKRAFDKKFDPNLPAMNFSFGSEWWDRAHNLFLEAGVGAGMPAVFIWLAVFFFLFLNLKGQSIRTAGLKATFFAYFLANLTSINTTSTLLSFFLLTGFALRLSLPQGEESKQPVNTNTAKKAIFIALIGAGLLSLYFLTIQPLFLNKRVNKASSLIKSGQCEKGLSFMDPATQKRGPVGSYSRIKYAEAADACIKEGIIKEQEANNLLRNTLKKLDRTAEEDPGSLQALIMLGIHSNRLLETTESNETKVQLGRKANEYFERAHLLSPKRTDILFEWSRSLFLWGACKSGLQKAETCLEIEGDHEGCLFEKGVNEICLADLKKGEEAVEKAGKLGFKINSTHALSAKVRALARVGEETGEGRYFERIVEIYKTLKKRGSENIDYRTSLVYAYQKLGQRGKAEEEALDILEIAPELRPQIEKFLEELR